jgi:DTW domain-containing protein YfiP
MDKATYLLKKQEQKENATKFKREEFCFTCFRLKMTCFCTLIKPFDTKTHFVLLLHPMEAKREKATGTGRLSLACLKNSQMIMGIDFTEDPQVNALIDDPKNYCMVLYPGEKAINVSNDDITPLQNLGDRRLVIFLIDGTWPCAKKMMRLSKNINTLPRISFTATHESLFVIKEQPAEFCLSTIESIHFFLSECDRRKLEDLGKKQDNMLDVFKAMVDFQIKCASDPTLPSYRNSKGGYSRKTERRKSKKWGTNRIVYKD